MKQYLISEEELKDFANNVKFNHPSVAVDWQTDQFLKSKQPVEEIASGNVHTIIVRTNEEIGIVEINCS